MIYKTIIRSIRLHIRTLKSVEIDRCNILIDMFQLKKLLSYFSRFINFIKDISEECYTIQISLGLVLIASDYVMVYKLQLQIFHNYENIVIKFNNLVYADTKRNIQEYE